VKKPHKIQLEDILRKSDLSESAIQLLSRYYGLVLKWNGRLHLTTLTQPAEFAERHIGESVLAAAKIMDSIEEVWDLGTGLGVPGIPIAILRPDLEVKLVESNRAKAIFLEEAATDLRLSNLNVHRKRIETLDEMSEVACITVRAVEQMEKVLLEVFEVGSRTGQILIFGNMQTELLMRDLAGREGRIISSLIPGSERRLLIEFIRFT
jgi:16S rRNA (guanine527-N7)-methyltransferase